MLGDNQYGSKPSGQGHRLGSAGLFNRRCWEMPTRPCVPR